MWNAAEEAGDLLFAAVNVVRAYGVAPEDALRAANAQIRNAGFASHGSDLQRRRAGNDFHRALDIGPTGSPVAVDGEGGQSWVNRPSSRGSSRTSRRRSGPRSSSPASSSDQNLAMSVKPGQALTIADRERDKAVQSGRIEVSRLFRPAASNASQPSPVKAEVGTIHFVRAHCAICSCQISSALWRRSDPICSRLR